MSAPRNDALMKETAGQSDTEHLLKLDVLSRSLERENSRLIFVLSQIIGSLPAKRDWLDSDLERIAKFLTNKPTP